VDHRDRRATYRGFGDGFTQAFETAVIPALLALGGLKIDQWLGSVPVFTVTLALVGMVACFLRIYYDYSAKIDAQEKDRVWTRTP
jgi:F0F1-type ATP synthase assembly protein I